MLIEGLDRELILGDGADSRDSYVSRLRDLGAGLEMLIKHPKRCFESERFRRRCKVNVSKKSVYISTSDKLLETVLLMEPS